MALFFLDECSAAAAGERRFMCIPCTGKSESRNDSPEVVLLLLLWSLRRGSSREFWADKKRSHPRARNMLGD